MPAYSPTLLLDAPEFAERLGVGRVVVKAETRRMGLPSFKILGASWATYKAICEHIGHEPEPWSNINELARNLAHLRPFKLATATDGNHGRAVSFMARLLGFECDVFVPAGMVRARIEAMEREGATVTVVDGDYDDAVARAAEEAGAGCLIVSDTSWPGYETTPAQVVEGYSTIFAEVDSALDASGLDRPDVVVVPMGVGAFMAAAVTHYRSDEHRPVIIGVEPLDANCVQASVLAGELSHVPGPHRSIMVGLNCGLPSLTAWPRLASGIDWLVSVDDDAARLAMRELADAAVASGETGAAALAGLDAILADEGARGELGDLSGSTILIVVTEGATDPDNFEAIVGRSPETVGRVLTALR
jgi:diaminopropionate ammonia-lyase